MKRILQTIPSLALPEDKEKWEQITSEALESGKYLSSCKSCHVKFKKSYKNLIKKISFNSKGNIKFKIILPMKEDMFKKLRGL